MDYSQKISERHWNGADKGERESNRENLFIDDCIQKAHIQREILSNIPSVKTVFDGGAGSGRFSIMLAKLGIHVTHFDISQPMIEKAKELAKQAGVEQNISFVKGSLEDLSAYEDKQFDMVISVDAPISYTYPNQERVISELIRVSNKKIVFSVSSRLGTLPYFSNPIQKNQFISDKTSEDKFVRWCVDREKEQINKFKLDREFLEKVWSTGLCEDVDKTIEAYNAGRSPWPITYLFMPEELKHILEVNGVQNIKLAGPGAYARTLPNEILVKIMEDEKVKQEFLDFCYKYDSNPYVCGMGKDNLLAVGDIALN